MNKQEKIISLILGLALAWCLYSTMGAKREVQQQQPAAQQQAAAAPDASSASNTVANASANAATNVAAQAQAVSNDVARAEAPKPPAIELHDTFVTISNAEEVVTFAANELGVGIDRIELTGYPTRNDAISKDNPPVTFDFGREHRALAIGGSVASVPDTAKPEFRADSPTSVVYRTSRMERRFTLLGDYRIGVEEKFSAGVAGQGANTLSVGAVALDKGPSAPELSIDSCLVANDKGKSEVVHHSEDDSLKGFLAKNSVGGCGCGCGGSQGPGTSAPRSFVEVPRDRRWVALKNNFFVTALTGCDQPNEGFVAGVERDMSSAAYRPGLVSADLKFSSVPERRAYTFYAGPKKQSLLWDDGMKDVMEFGMWSWLCYPMVWLLTVFHAAIPNYGIAIILLTILVRLIFWPLTRKSTESMKKMQEIQPLLKEIQAKYKDNPQRMQQETWALYKEKKVNPLSSCLPMLIQIPVFIALFQVLRSAVELRYAGFLWISDLSEPERLFASWFPFGGLNILPILMAATMYLQSKLTPSTGDKSQQRMMTVFMPLMMLVMFYSFASALSLYWTLSQVISILQMWLMRRKSAAAALTPEVIPPETQTRQMRRHG